MPTYVVLYHFTDQGAKNIKGTVQRANEARADNERRGFKVQGLYWTQGHYDLVAIVDAPDEQAMLAACSTSPAPATSVARHCERSPPTTCKPSCRKCDGCKRAWRARTSPRALH